MSCAGAGSVSHEHIIHVGRNNLRHLVWRGPIHYHPPVLGATKEDEQRSTEEESPSSQLTFLELSKAKEITPYFTPASFGYHLARDVMKWTAMEKLHLIVPYIGAISDDAFQLLCQACARLPLRSLLLDCSGHLLCEIEGAINSIGEAKRLESLCIRLARNPLGKARSHGKFVAEALVRLPHTLNRLTKYHLDVSACGLDFHVCQELNQKLHTPILPLQCRATLNLLQNKAW